MSRKSKRRSFRRWFLTRLWRRRYVIGFDMVYTASESAMCVWRWSVGPDGIARMELLP